MMLLTHPSSPLFRILSLGTLPSLVLFLLAGCVGGHRVPGPSMVPVFQGPLHGHPNKIEIDPSGKLISVVNDEGIVFIDAISGQIRARQPINARLRYAASSPDGGTIALITENSILLWDVSSLETKYRIDSGQVQDWSPDSTRLAITLAGELVVYDATTGKQLWRTDPGTGDRLEVFWSPDGAHLIANGYGDGLLVVLDASNGQVVHSFPGHLFRYFDGRTPFAWSPDGRYLAALGSNLEVLIRDMADGQVIKRAPAGESSNIVLAFHPEEPVLAIGGEDLVTLWAYQSGDTRHLTVPKGDGEGFLVTALLWSADGERLAANSFDEGISWSVEDGVATSRIKLAGKLMDDEPVWSADLRRVVTQYGWGVRIWDGVTATVTHTLPGLPKAYWNVEAGGRAFTLSLRVGIGEEKNWPFAATWRALNPPLHENNGAVLLLSGVHYDLPCSIDWMTGSLSPDLRAVGCTGPGRFERQPEVVDLVTAETLSTFDCRGYGRRWSWSRTGRYLGTVHCGDDYVSIRVAETGEELIQLPCDFHFAIRWSGDEQYVLVGSRSDWFLGRVEAGAAPEPLSGCNDPIFSPNGHQIFCAGDLLDAETQAVVAEIPLGSTDAPLRTPFSPDGGRFAGRDTRLGPVEVFDIASQTMTTLPGTEGQEPEWSPSGALLATGDAASIRIWNGRSLEPITELENGRGDWHWLDGDVAIAIVEGAVLSLGRIHDGVWLHVVPHFEDGRYDFVTYTDQGVFDGPEALLDQLYLRDQGDFRESRLSPARDASKRLYHPGLLKAFLAGEDVSAGRGR